MTENTNRIALVIGNAAYAHAPRLMNPLNDAREIAAALTRIGFKGVILDTSTNVSSRSRGVSPLVDLDYNNLRKVLAAFARASDQADQAVLYYAGHGIEVGGENYLIPIDGHLAGC